MSTMTDFTNSGVSLQAQIDANTNAIKALAGRNKVINGLMRVAQRGASFPAVGSTSHTLDRWAASHSGTAVRTISQELDAPASFSHSLKYLVTTASASLSSGDHSAVAQHVEGFNITQLIGKTFTLSFWVKASKAGVYCASFRNDAADRSYVAEYTVDTPNTWEKKSITVVGGLDPTGTWVKNNGLGLRLFFIVACGSDYTTATVGTWIATNRIASTRQVNGADAVNNAFFLTGVQLELGDRATEFEVPTPSDELLNCQRYYQMGSLVALAKNSTYFGGSWLLPVKMRTTPSGFYSSNGVDNRVQYDGGYATVLAGGIILMPDLIGWDAIMSVSATNWWRFDYRISAEL